MNGTTTKTTTVSAMKIAVALAFLGASALLAAAGMLRPDIKRPQKNVPPPVLVKVEIPDLVITKMVLTAGDIYDGVSDVELSVQYQNIGKGVVAKPFQIAITTDPVGLFGDAGLVIGQADKPSDKNGDDNKYNLVPGESAVMKIALKRKADVILDGGYVRFVGYVDYIEKNPVGNVPELVETNNENSLISTVVKTAQNDVVVPVPEKIVEPTTPKKIDMVQFCDASGTNKPTACADRLAAVSGLPVSSYNKIFNTYSCAGVYQGIPIIKVNGKYNVIEIDGTMVLGGTLGGCTLSSTGGVVSSVLDAKKCIDELHTTFETSPVYSKLYLSWQTCYNPKNFCSSTSLNDPKVCEKRLKAIPELSKQTVDDLLKKYACVGVYKGIPMVKVQTQVVPLQLDNGFLLSNPLSKCTLAELGVVTSFETAVKCLDQLSTVVKNDPMYLVSECANN